MERTWKRYLNLWSELSGWRWFVFYTLHYTCVFLILQYFIFSDFREVGKSLLWRQDGMPVYFTRLVYLSQTFREGIQSFLQGEGWQIPLYDFNLGYVKSDFQIEPIQLLAVLWPWDKIDVLYDLLVLVRLYFVGLSFSAFGFYWKQKPLFVLLGAITYTFCGFSLFGTVRHPFFAAPMIYLPLLLIGMEEVLQKKRPYLLTSIVFFAATTHVYFACMLAILVVIYTMVRFFDIYKENYLREFSKIVGRLAIAGGTGILLSGITMVPMFLQLIGTGRAGRTFSLMGNIFYYTNDRYEKLFASFLGEVHNIGSFVGIGFSILAIPTVIAVFLQKSKANKNLRKYIVILTIMLCIPAFSYLLSGFNSYYSRWSFAYAFLIAAILMFNIQWFIDEWDERHKVVYVICIVYCFACYVKKYIDFNVVLLFFSAMLILYICSTFKKNRRLIMQICCFMLVCYSVCYSSFMLYDSRNGNFPSDFVIRDRAYNYYDISQYGAFAKSKAKKEDESFYRVTGGSISRPSSNASFYYDINGSTGMGIHGYYNTYWDWLWELETGRRSGLMNCYDTDARTMQLAQESIKYYLIREGACSSMPYGYEEIQKVENKKDKITDIIYKNKYALPVGYTYDSYMTSNVYDQLLPLHRQEAQLQAVKLEVSPQSIEIEEQIPEFFAKEIDVKVTGSDGLSWKNGKLKVKKENATMTLSFEGVKNTETYVRMVNLDLTDGVSERKWYLTAETEHTATTSMFCADAYIYSNGMKTQLMNLGYTEEGYTTCTLTFPEKGTFILDDIEIWCQPMDKYPEYINALREEVLENVETNWRGLTGTISVSKDKMLCLSIPYDKGWKAYVDGEKVDLYQANTAFMALELEKGDHVVELKYLPPGMGIGMVMTAAGIVSLAGIIIYNRKKK